MKLSGIYPALMTPFKSNMEINHESLRKLIRLNIQKGVDGFYVCGSTAEVFMLSMAQRKEVLETVIDEVKGRVGVIVQVGSISQDQANELAIHARKAGANAVSAVPPFYYGFTMDDIRTYYLSIADSGQLPVLIYNIPAYSGVKMTVNDIKPLLLDSRFIGVKHTSSDFYMLERLKSIRKNLVVFNGLDENFLAGISMGADGGIGSTYNFMAEKFVNMMMLYENGKMQEALSEQHRVNNILEFMLKIGLMSAEKEALNLMGIDMGLCAKPFPVLSSDDIRKLYTVLENNGCIGLQKQTIR